MRAVFDYLVEGVVRMGNFVQGVSALNRDWGSSGAVPEHRLAQGPGGTGQPKGQGEGGAPPRETHSGGLALRH